MILRRFADALRRQDWFVVVLEIFIVVIGIFIGLQVDDWNKERNNRVLEQEYLERLHEEITESIQSNIAAVDLALTRTHLMRELGEFFNNDAAAVQPGSEHCVALYRTHIFSGEVLSLPTIDEMLATGRILLISDNALKAALIRYDQSVARLSLLLKEMQNGRLLLSRVHPDLVRLNPVDTYGDQAICNFAAMRSDQEFINNFVDNTGRFEAYAEQILKGQQERRRELHAGIDRALGRIHGENAK